MNKNISNKSDKIKIFFFIYLQVETGLKIRAIARLEYNTAAERCR